MPVGNGASAVHCVKYSCVGRSTVFSPRFQVTVVEAA